MKIRTNVQPIKAAREFTDREEPRAAFWKQYAAVKAELQGEDCNVHVLGYYGIGGIGKSTLLKKLMSEMDEQVASPRYVYFDLNFCQESRSVLDRLKNKLSDQYKFAFPLFELGSYVYAQKVGDKPDSLEVQQITERSPFLNLMLKVAGSIPVVGVAATVLEVADQSVAMVRSHLKQHSRELARIEYMEADELYKYLPYLFARDMANAMQKTDKNTEPLVILLDTYETLVNELSQVGEPLKNDEWIRGEDGLVQNIPGVLWVIAGREKLKWERFDADWGDALEQHILGSLSIADSDQFLKSSGIGDPALREQLYKLTAGTPVYLDLCVDQYLRMCEKGVTPEIAMFGRNTYDLIERFVRYMDQGQKDLVYMLACLQKWDDELIAQLAPSILSNFSFSAYERVKEYSFITKSNDGSYNVHQTVGEVLLEDCAVLIKQRTGKCLLEQFSKTLEEKCLLSADYAAAFTYAMQAGLLLYADNEELRSFYEQTLRDHLLELARAGRFISAGAALELLLARAKQEAGSRFCASLLCDKALYAVFFGDYKAAQMLAEESIELYTNLLGNDHLDTIRAISALSDALTYMAQYEEVLKLDTLVFEKRTHSLGEDHPDTLDAMGKVAYTLGVLRRDQEALQLKTEVMEKRRAVLGEDHPDTLKAINTLAVTYENMGNTPKALELKQLVLDKRRVILGEDHPHTLGSMLTLAVSLTNAGKLKEAMALEMVVLEKRRAILGEDHPNTLTVMNNLAISLEDAGRFEEALALKEEVLEKRRLILGEDHPDTLSAMNNLAIAFEEAGQQQEALTMKKEVLEKRRLILGEDHPDTLSAMNNLAIALKEAGQLQEALAMKKEVLEKRRLILGEDHPDTLSAMNSLAIAFEEAGQQQEALDMKKEVLEKRRLILGEDHPDTLISMNNLAVALENTNDLEGAIALRTKLLEKRRRVLGEDHLDTINTMVNLALDHEALGQLDKTKQLEEEVLERRRRILGDDHPDTIRAMKNLSITFHNTKDIAGALALRTELLERQRRVLGDDHPETIHTMVNLALDHEALGQPDKTKQLEEEVLERRRRILGDDHPDTLRAMGNFAITLQSVNDLERSLALRNEVLERRLRILGEDHPDTIRAMKALAAGLKAVGELDRALSVWNDACEREKRQTNV